MNISEIIEKLLAGNNLDISQARETMDRLMEGGLDEAQIGGLLIALRAKGETPEEIAGFARSMREHARGFEVDSEYRPLIDTCGTGGDSVETVNISTMAALVAAGAGARVAKHGNRSVSSNCGSADLLEALGVKIELEPQQVKKCIEEVGIGFMYAPKFHAAMKYAIGPRKSLGVRTVFNLLGPLTNPAGADRQLLGVFSERWVKPVALALKELGVQRALVVHGSDGMDEISLSAETVYAELDDGLVKEGRFSPEDFGVAPVKLSEIAGGELENNLNIARRLFAGEAPAPIERIVAVNAGVVLYLAFLAPDMPAAVELALKTIKSGSSRNLLNKLIDFSNSV
ncbi:MAG: anthranilate phosphoribosyltransferase [bacterium]